MKIIKTNDGSKTLYSEDYKQSFHSNKGALAESRHVFLETSGVRARLEGARDTKVLEVGFGTGFNFFLTADLAIKYSSRLEYVALEQTLLTSQTIDSLDYHSHLVSPEILTAFLEYRNGYKGQGGFLFEFEGVRLLLKLGDAQKQKLPTNHFDAVYQDAFSPKENPELWSTEFLAKLKTSLKRSGKLSTYSVQGQIRKKLSGLGFKVTKLPGPKNGKREILLARLA